MQEFTIHVVLFYFNILLYVSIKTHPFSYLHFLEKRHDEYLEKLCLFPDIHYPHLKIKRSIFGYSFCPFKDKDGLFQIHVFILPILR